MLAWWWRHSTKPPWKYERLYDIIVLALMSQLDHLTNFWNKCWSSVRIHYTLLQCLQCVWLETCSDRVSPPRFCSRAEAAQLLQPAGPADGAVRGVPAQGGHADGRLQLQPHCAERKGPKPRAGHRGSLLLVPAPLLRRLVLLEHRNSGRSTRLSWSTSYIKCRVACNSNGSEERWVIK